MEFALVVTVLFAMIFGILDFSRAMFAYHFASYAAREATRYASVHGSTYTTQCPASSPFVPTNNCKVVNTANVSSFVQSLASGIYISRVFTSGSNTNAGNLTVTTTWPGSNGNPAGCKTAGGTNSPGCPVRVVVKYIYGFSLPFITGHISNITMSNITMRSTSQVVISQ